MASDQGIQHLFSLVCPNTWDKCNTTWNPLWSCIMQTARVHSRFSACAVWYKIWIVRFFKETLQCASTDFSGTVRSNSRLYIPHVQSILYTSSLHMSADRIYLDAFVFMSLEGPRQAKHVFAHTKNLYRFIYSWLSLSRTRLSRITAYLKVKICSLPKNENLTTYKKYCGKEEKLLLRSNFSSFSQYFQYISNFKSPITHIFVKCG